MYQKKHSEDNFESCKIILLVGLVFYEHDKKKGVNLHLSLVFCQRILYRLFLEDLKLTGFLVLSKIYYFT